MAITCLRPSILTVTVPPPEEASTTVCSIFFCSVSYCCLACDMISCKLKPDIENLLTAETPGNKFNFFSFSLRLGGSNLLFLPIVDHGADFGAELFLHALHDRIMFG